MLWKAYQSAAVALLRAAPPMVAPSAPFALALLVDDVVAVPRRELARGETLFRQGDAPRGLHIVELGRVRLLRYTAAGERVTVHVARAGESFAEAALFSPRHHCDAVADVRSRVAVVPRAGVDAALAADPRLALELAARLAAQVQELRTRLELRNVRRALERVRLYLALLAAPDGALPHDRPLADLASDIGLTPEAFYRALGELKAAGRLRGHGRTLRMVARPREP